MTFTTLDFETATSNRNSACEIGVTWVNDGVIGRTEAFLIQPPDNEYDYFNTSIHGLDSHDTALAPGFGEVWNDLAPKLHGQVLVAHNTGFDISVLRQSLDYCDVDHPVLEFACSYALSKRILKGLPSYSLDSLCAHHGIQLTHHRAGPDSRATAELMLHLFSQSASTTIHDLVTEHTYKIGSLGPGTYSGCLAKRNKEYQYRPSLKIVGDPTKHRPESAFYGKGVAFTGTMSSMTRHEATQLVADIGATVQSGVSSKTEYLVVGQQDYRRLGESGMSSKQTKAMKLVADGQQLEVLSEDAFLQLL